MLLFFSIIPEHIDMAVPSWHTSIKTLVVDITSWYSNLFMTNHIYFLITVFLQQPKHSIKQVQWGRHEARNNSNCEGPFLVVFWEHTSDLHVPLGDAVHEWLVVSFSGLVLQFFLVPVNNSKTVSKCWYCQRSNCLNFILCT